MKHTIEVPFEIGQEVWPIQNRHEQVWKTCAACEGKGVITLANGERHCPECYGRKGGYQYLPTRWMIAEGKDNEGHFLYASPLKIGQIRVQIGQDPEVSVMCYETGVGSGTLWNGETIFTTKEEAETECASRNAMAEAEIAREEAANG